MCFVEVSVTPISGNEMYFGYGNGVLLVCYSQADRHSLEKLSRLHNVWHHSLL